MRTLRRLFLSCWVIGWAGEDLQAKKEGWVARETKGFGEKPDPRFCEWMATSIVCSLGFVRVWGPRGLVCLVGRREHCGFWEKG